MKIIRLTAKIFKPGEHELQRYAAAGLSMTQVHAEDPAAIAAAVGDADVVSVIGTPMPRVVIDALGAGRCRAIARFGTGTDKIDVARATELGIVVCNTPFFCIEEMADHVMAMLLYFNRALKAQHQSMVDGDLPRARSAMASANRMSHSTLGLIGFGRSAVHTARRARGFGMRVLATRNNRNAPRDEADALGVIMTDVDTVLRESDYVSLHVPLTSKTQYMIDAAALAKMKRTAVLINTSRGKLVDEGALYAALSTGKLAGAGIDTFGSIDIFVDHIPPPVHPLAALDNVVLSPHTGGGGFQARFDMMDAGIQNLIDLRDGVLPVQENLVNPSVTPRFPFASRSGPPPTPPQYGWDHGRLHPRWEGTQ